VKYKESGGKCAQGPEELEARVGSCQEPKLSGLLLNFLIFYFLNFFSEKMLDFFLKFPIDGALFWISYGSRFNEFF
jgi:hypothetical protein